MQKYKDFTNKLILFCALFFCSSAWAANNEINGVRFWDAPDTTRIILDLKNRPNFESFRLANPNRIILDLNQTEFKGDVPYVKRSHRHIKNIRQARRNNKSRRVVIDTKGLLDYRTYTLLPNKSYGHRLVIELSKKEKKANQVVHPEPKTNKRQAPTAHARLRDIIIAIDAGHGGEDPGAIGKFKTQEKRIALSIAKKLKREIDKQKGMRGVLIRKGDYYISLRKRMEIARAARADMFVSIHADAFKNPRVKGSSVFVLSAKGASDESAKWLANRENASDLVGGVSLDDKEPVLARVLLDLSQTATIDASTRAASNILSEIGKVGPVHKNKVQSAKFVVLKSPDIPSILVETAFISNPQEERRLKNGRYQDKLAKAITRGVKRYFKKSPPPNTRLAASNQRSTDNVVEELSKELSNNVLKEETKTASNNNNKNNLTSFADI